MTRQDHHAQKDTRLPINTWKALGIFMVLGIHTTGSYILHYKSVRALHQVLAINVLVSGAVALFLFASGYGLTKKYGEERNLGWKNFVFPKLAKILPGYVLWSLAYAIFQHQMEGKPLSLRILLEDLLLGRGMYHLYYMVFFLQLLILFPWLLRLQRRVGGYGMLFLAGVVQLLSFRSVAYPWSSVSCTSYLFYFVWGMVAKGGVSSGWKKAVGGIWYLTGCILKFVEYESEYNVDKTPVRLLGYDHTYFFQAAATIFLAMQLVPLVDRWLEKPTAGFLRKRVREMVRLLGELSPLIYYVHPMILSMGIRLGGRYTVNAGGIKVLVLWLLLTGGSVIGAMGLRWMRREGMKGLFG